MNNHSTNDSPERPRKEAILGGLAVVASLMVAFNPFGSKEKKAEKITMLGEDGKLIEVDASVIANSSKRKATDKELQEWIKEK